MWAGISNSSVIVGRERLVPTVILVTSNSKFRLTPIQLSTLCGRGLTTRHGIVMAIRAARGKVSGSQDDSGIRVIILSWGRTVIDTA